LRLTDSQGKLVLAPVTLQFQAAGARLVPGQEVSISTVTVLQPMFGEPGVYTTEFWTGGNRIGAMNLNVGRAESKARHHRKRGPAWQLRH
jgi:hypothetical protein